MELKGSKTEANLWKAFAGESMARNKYTYFASKARKEGYEQIAAIFEETAGNEKEHAKLWFKALSGIGDTAANLIAAAEGEHEEWTEMYKAVSYTHLDVYKRQALPSSIRCLCAGTRPRRRTSSPPPSRPPYSPWRRAAPAFATGC